MITVKNTNTPHAIYDYIVSQGVEEESRNGPVISVPHPVTICYERPAECVNMCPERDANPFFHFMEMLWFLEARRDVKFITRYLPRMKEYSDDGVIFNAHYGYNIRRRWGLDQLHGAIDELKRNPNTRQAVVQIWNQADLFNRVTVDKACNTHLVFRIVDGRLNMTVYNRSNDAIWGGVTGANITNLYVFQAYVAAGIQAPVGVQYVVSNNLHLYLDNPKTQLMIDKYVGKEPTAVQYLTEDPYTRLQPTALLAPGEDICIFDYELSLFMNELRVDNQFWCSNTYRTFYLHHIARPIARAHHWYRVRQFDKAYNECYNIMAEDWKEGIMRWLDRRVSNNG